MIVLDTSAISAVMHGIPGAVTRLGHERPDDVILIAPVAAEIQFGLERLAHGSRRRRLLDAEYRRLRAALRFEDWTEQAAIEFGQQKARLDKEGALIEDFDLAIGACAIVLGARLGTLNVKHLSRVAGLEVIEWT